MLKHYTASQLHPSTPHGSAFWNKMNALTSAHHSFDLCFRVWIVPGKVEVRETMVGDQGNVVIEKLGLEVLSEEDYETLRQFRESQNLVAVVPRTPERYAEVVGLFRELIVPEIQREVSIGPRFGLLRQVLSVLVVAKWIMQSQLGDALTKAGFVGCNAPERFGLNTVDDSVLVEMKNLYLQMFCAGVWQHASTKVELDSGRVEKRLYVAGGIEVNPMELPRMV